MDRTAEDRAAIWLCRGTGLLIFLVVAALYPWSNKPPIDIKELIAAWGVVMLITGVMFSPTATKKIGPIIASLVAFCGWMSLTGLTSDHPGHSLYFIHVLVSGVATAWAVSQFVHTEEHARILVKATVWATALGSVYAFFQYLGIDPMPWAEEELTDEAYTGLPGPFGNANLAAHALAVSIVGAIYLGWGRQFWIYGPLALVFGLHLYRTGQRGAIVALAVALILCALVWALRRGTLSVDRKIMATVFGALVITAVLIGTLLSVHRVTRGYTLPVDSSVLMRYNSFYGAAEMIRDAPILGVGYGNYFIENPPYWTDFEQRWFASRLMSNGHVHNDLLESGVEGGILGAALHLGIFVLALWQALRWAFGGDPVRARLGLGLAAWFTVFFVDGLFGFNMRVPATALFLFVLLGATAGLAMPAPEKGKRKRMLESAIMAVCVMAAVLSSIDFFLSHRLKRAVDAREQGYPSAAVTIFESAAPLNYWSWEFAWEHARTLDLAGRPEDAHEAFKETNARIPYFPYSLAGAAQAAVHVASSGIEMDRARRGELLVYAQRCTDRALELCPELSAAHEMRGRLYTIQAKQATRNPEFTGQRTQAYRDAADAFRAALVYGEGRRESIYLMISSTLRELGDRDGALTAMRKAADEAPLSSSVWAAYYADGLQRGNLDLFRKTFIEVVGAIEERSLYTEALYRYWNDEVPLAVIAERMLQAAEQNPPVLADKAMIKGHALVLDILANAARTAIDDNQARAKVFAILGAHYLLIGSPQDTAPLFEAAWPYLEGGDLVNITVYLAQYYWERADNARALSIVEDSMGRLPASPQIGLMYARSLGKAGQFDAGIAAYGALLSEFPDMPADLRSIAEQEQASLEAAARR